MTKTTPYIKQRQKQNRTEITVNNTKDRNKHKKNVAKEDEMEIDESVIDEVEEDEVSTTTEFSDSDVEDDNGDDNMDTTTPSNKSKTVGTPSKPNISAGIFKLFDNINNPNENKRIEAIVGLTQYLQRSRSKDKEAVSVKH